MFIIKDREAIDLEIISCVSSHLGGGEKSMESKGKRKLNVLLLYYFISLLHKAEVVNVTLKNSPYTVGFMYSD